MKRATYKLAGAIATERGINGLEITTPEATTLEEALSLVQDGDINIVLKKFQGNLDVERQKKIRDAAESEEVADILAGKVVDGVDYAAHNDDERKDAVRMYCQAAGDAFVPGAPRTTNGAGAVVKSKAANADKIAAAAANDPELAAKLAALGITL